MSYPIVYIQPQLQPQKVLLQPIQYIQPIVQPQFIQPQIIQQSISSSPPSYTPPKSEWHTGLCDCCQSPCICISGILCPCCLFGRNAKGITDEGCISNCLCYLLCCPPLQHSGLRRKIRNKWNLPEDPCNDCCVALFCGPCGMCQEAREIEYRLSQPGQQTMN
jgi:Cys-rich protein (TIGR01571 family)